MQGIAAFPPGPRPPRTLESRTGPGYHRLYSSSSQHRPKHSPLSQWKLLMRLFLVLGAVYGPPLFLRGPAGGRSESPRPCDGLSECAL